MAEATRDPQSKTRTAATAAAVGFPTAFIIAMFFPEMAPETAVGVTALLAWLPTFVGAQARDWVYRIERQDPAKTPSFLVEQLSKIG